MTYIGLDVGKKEHLLLLGLQIGPTTMVTGVAIPQKAENTPIIRTSYIIFGNSSKRICTLLQKNLFICVQCFSIHNIQEMEKKLDAHRLINRQ